MSNDNKDIFYSENEKQKSSTRPAQSRIVQLNLLKYVQYLCKSVLYFTDL